MDVRYAMYTSLALGSIIAGIVRDGYTLTKRFSEYLPLLPRPARGQPVLLIPGLLANDASLLPLAGALRRLGYHAETWGCGLNTAEHQPRMMERIIEKILALHRASGMHVVVIGHSLGGLYAVCAAHTCGAKRVRSVITIGSPVNLNPALVNPRTRDRLARVSGKTLEEHLMGNQLLEKVSTLPTGVPVTTVATHRDTVVGMDSCRYHDVGPGNCYTGIEVFEPTHSGLLLHPETFVGVLDRAFYDEKNWKPLDLGWYTGTRWSIASRMRVHTP